MIRLFEITTNAIAVDYIAVAKLLVTVVFESSIVLFVCFVYNEFIVNFVVVLLCRASIIIIVGVMRRTCRISLPT